MYPENLRYTKTHEWVRISGDRATIGITAHAVDALGDIVSFDLPNPGTTVTADDVLGSVDSVKAASDIYSPVSGEIVQINEAVLEDPDLLKEDPYNEGWIAVIKISDPSQVEHLMTAQQYQGLIESVR